jgi:hypothetical protein
MYKNISANKHQKNVKKRTDERVGKTKDKV